MLYFRVVWNFPCLCCVHVVCWLWKNKKRKTKNDVFYFSARRTRSGIIVLYFARVGRALALLCYISARGTRSGVIVLYFSARGTRSSVILLYFPLMERALALFCCIFPRVDQSLSLLCYIFCVWNTLWRYCVIFSARGTRSGILC